MKNYLMPITLAAVIVVAGIFAFSPVEQASTVHDDVQAELDLTGQLFCDLLEGLDNTTYESDTSTCDAIAPPP